ncbi:flagellar hook-length control protein FliK [Salipiger sp.]|uniref:flagellar hook-length control protein FliK n=1 Tax=Salipiger sp. TaxID=2078585 RepID=UPI003A9872B0
MLNQLSGGAIGPLQIRNGAKALEPDGQADFQTILSALKNGTSSHPGPQKGPTAAFDGSESVRIPPQQKRTDEKVGAETETCETGQNCETDREQSEEITIDRDISDESIHSSDVLAHLPKISYNRGELQNTLRYHNLILNHCGGHNRCQNTPQELSGKSKEKAIDEKACATEILANAKLIGETQPISNQADASVRGAKYRSAETFGTSEYTPLWKKDAIASYVPPLNQWSSTDGAPSKGLSEISKNVLPGSVTTAIMRETKETSHLMNELKSGIVQILQNLHNTDTKEIARSKLSRLQTQSLDVASANRELLGNGQKISKSNSENKIALKQSGASGIDSERHFGIKEKVVDSKMYTPPAVNLKGAAEHSRLIIDARQSAAIDPHHLSTDELNSESRDTAEGSKYRSNIKESVSLHNNKILTFQSGPRDERHNLASNSTESSVDRQMNSKEYERNYFKPTNSAKVSESSNDVRSQSIRQSAQVMDANLELLKPPRAVGPYKPNTVTKWSVGQTSDRKADLGKLPINLLSEFTLTQRGRNKVRTQMASNSRIELAPRLQYTAGNQHTQISEESSEACPSKPMGTERFSQRTSRVNLGFLSSVNGRRDQSVLSWEGSRNYSRKVKYNPLVSGPVAQKVINGGLAIHRSYREEPRPAKSEIADEFVMSGGLTEINEIERDSSRTAPNWVVQPKTDPNRYIFSTGGIAELSQGYVTDYTHRERENLPEMEKPQFDPYYMSTENIRPHKISTAGAAPFNGNLDQKRHYGEVLIIGLNEEVSDPQHKENFNSQAHSSNIDGVGSISNPSNMSIKLTSISASLRVHQTQQLTHIDPSFGRAVELRNSTIEHLVGQTTSPSMHYPYLETSRTDTAGSKTLSINILPNTTSSLQPTPAKPPEVGCGVELYVPRKSYVIKPPTSALYGHIQDEGVDEMSSESLSSGKSGTASRGRVPLLADILTLPQKDKLLALVNLWSLAINPPEYEGLSNASSPFSEVNSSHEYSPPNVLPGPPVPYSSPSTMTPEFVESGSQPPMCSDFSDPVLAVLSRVDVQRLVRIPTGADVHSNVRPSISSEKSPTFSSELEVDLKPVELGRVRFTLSQSDGGLMVAISADRPETIDMFKRNIIQLSSYLSEMGYESSSFSFSEGEYKQGASEMDQSALVDVDADEVHLETNSHVNGRNEIAADGLDLRL